MQEQFIDRPEQLATFVEAMHGARWLAVDTEFIRERTYFPRLCLIQIASEEIAACIDPLKIEDLSPLKALLLDPGITKVFHAARQDLEIFLHIWGELPTPIFDTQPAAALLGIGDQVGYGNLIQQVLGINLAKDHSRTDWSRRPLQKAQMRYALDDVIYLGQAYRKMRRQLEEQGRLEWLEAEFESLADPATYALEPMAMWQRVKGRQHLKGVRLAILQQLARAREPLRTGPHPRTGEQFRAQQRRGAAGTADEAGLSPQVIASRKDLAALLRNEPQARLLQGWRRKLAGEPLHRLLSGEHRIILQDGVPLLQT